MRKIEFEELCKLYPVEYKQDKDYPQLIVFRNGIIYNQKTSSVTGHIKQNRIDTGYGLAHQLVMKNFGTSVPKDMVDPTIDHIDELDFVDDIYGRHLNNDISNLQWMSGPDNIKKAFKNEKWSERRSQKISKAQKETWNQPEVRERRSKAQKEAQSRPEVRKKHSISMIDKNTKSVRCIETDIKYKSIRGAAKELNIPEWMIYDYLYDKRKDCYGLHFERISKT